MASITADAVHLRASGVSLVVAVGDRRLPRVVHWGADLGDLDAATLSVLIAASAAPHDSAHHHGDGRAEHHAVAILPEHSWGWLGTPGVSGHRDGRDHSTRFAVGAIDLASEGAGDRAIQRLSVRAADSVADLAVTIVIEMLASGLVRARATLESTGPGSGGVGSGGVGSGAAPYSLDALMIVLPVPTDAREIGDFPGAPGRARAAFAPGTHARESRRGTPGPGGAPLIAAGTTGFGFRTGEVWLTHVAWSGNTRHLAERAEDGTAIIGGGELLFPGEVRLGSGTDGGGTDGGASYASPWVYFAYGSGLDGASSRIHRYLRARAEHPTKPRPVVVTTSGIAHDLARLTQLADAAADLGAELFILGDGWFKGRSARGSGLGDWYVDKTVFPEGLRPFADYVRTLGLEFGMWFEPEMISPDSDLARQHPEWIAQASLAGASLRLPLEQRFQQVLDLTHPGAYAHIEERLHALVGELRPAHLVWDHRRDLLEAGSPTSGRAIGHGQTLAFYRLLDGLRAAFPGLEIEVRSAGGGRADLEVLQRAERVRASRVAKVRAPGTGGSLDQRSLSGTTALLVPPELTGMDIGRLPAARGGTVLDPRSSGAFWAHLGMEWDVADADVPSVGERDALRGWIELHKRYRKLLHTGDVVRSDSHTPDAVVRGVVSRDRREALFAFEPKGDATAAAPLLVRLDGLDPARAYRLSRVSAPCEAEAIAPPASGWWDRGVTVTGRMLAAHGIQAPPLSPSGITLIRVERA
jgi:alpha-galactosidase